MHTWKIGRLDSKQKVTNREKVQIINELRREMNGPLFVLLDIDEMSSNSYYAACQREYQVDDQEVINEISSIRKEFKDYGY